MLAAIPYHPVHTAHTGREYIDQLMGLYNNYHPQNNIDKLLVNKISILNVAVRKYIDSRENFYILFCEDNYEKVLCDLKDLKEKTEFLLLGLNLVYNNSKDNKLKNISLESIEVLQDFVIKIMKYSELCQELQDYNGEVDENSDEYKTKMAEIAEYILSKNSAKSGNSIRSLLAV